MDLNDLQPSVRLQDRYGYVYHTTFKHPKTGRLLHYIGQKRRATVDRHYSGSGVIIKALTEKYGRRETTHTRILGWESDFASLNATEIWLIREAKRLWGDDCVNLDYGGRGIERYKPETIEKFAAAKRGCTASAETRAKMSKSRKGISRSFSEEHKAALSAARQGMKLSETHRANIAASATGRKLSKASRDKIGTALRGIQYPMRTCPHCGKQGGGGAMTHYHFDNCKLA